MPQIPNYKCLYDFLLHAVEWWVVYMQAVKRLDSQGILDIRIHLTSRKPIPKGPDGLQVSLAQLDQPIIAYCTRCGRVMRVSLSLENRSILLGVFVGMRC